MDQPYIRLQSQGQGHVKRTTVVASLMLFACLVAENMHCDLHQRQGQHNEHGLHP